MNGHNLIVIGLVLVAVVAHAAVWWSSKRIWDGVVIGAVLCLAGMAIDTTESGERRVVTTIEGPYTMKLLEVLSRIEQDRKDGLHAARHK